MKTKISRLLSATFTTMVLLMLANSATAGVIYDVNRAWLNATLVGTVDVDLGSYNITNQGAHPFNSVNLVLTVGSTSYNVNNVLTDIISGSGDFGIQATSTQLIFSPVGNGSNPADLVFSDAGPLGNVYIIGSNGDPAFEVAYTGAGTATASPGPTFPLVWGTVSSVPEPTALLLLGLALAGFGFTRRKTV